MLHEKIAEMQKQMQANAPANLLTELGEEIQKIIASDIASAAKQPGAEAVSFELPDDNGEIFSLDEALKQGPVVLQFNRGTWCPYCDLQMKALQEKLSEIKEAKAELVIIMPQLSDQVKEYKKENGIEFKILQDQGNEMAALYGLRFTLPEKMQELYQKFKIDIPGSNGDDNQTLPIPATYVISPDKKITYAFVDPNWTNRPEPNEMITALKAL